MFQKKLQPYIPPLLATSFASAPSANSTPISAMADHRNDVVENDFINPHKHVQYNLNSKIMLTAIISLSLVVVLVTVLHIYSRCLLRRQARQRAALHQLRRVVSIPEPPKTGLSLAVIAALPMFPFRQTNGFDETGQIDCAVCLSVLENDDLVRMLPNCKHTFHAECIDKWLVSNSTCPVCRSHAEPRLVLEPLEAAQPSAPPAEPVNSNMINQEGSTSESSNQNTSKISIGSRLSSFRRILTRERSWCRIQNYREELGLEDLERQ